MALAALLLAAALAAAGGEVLLAGNEFSSATLSPTWYFRFGDNPEGSAASTCRVLALRATDLLPNSYAGYRLTRARVWLYAPSAAAACGALPCTGNPPAQATPPASLTCNVGAQLFELDNFGVTASSYNFNDPAAFPSVTTASFKEERGAFGFDGRQLYYLDIDLSALGVIGQQGSITKPNGAIAWVPAQTFQELRVWASGCVVGGTTPYNLYAAAATAGASYPGGGASVYDYVAPNQACDQGTVTFGGNTVEVAGSFGSGATYFPLVAFYGDPPFSPTPSVTGTASCTPSTTGAASPTPTRTPPASASPTPTRSGAASATPSRTRSATPSGTLSRTRSATPSATPSRTRSPSATPTPTASRTPSASRTPAATPSSTASLGATASGTASSTPSPPATPSGTPSRTPSLPASASASGLPSASRTPSPPATRTPSQTPSPTQTRTGTQTPSHTGTPTGSLSAGASSSGACVCGGGAGRK